MKSVYSAVRTGSLNKADYVSSLKGLINVNILTVKRSEEVNFDIMTRLKIIIIFKLRHVLQFVDSGPRVYIASHIFVTGSFISRRFHDT